MDGDNKNALEKAMFGNVENGCPVIKEYFIVMIVDTISKHSINRKYYCAILLHSHIVTLDPICFGFSVIFSILT